MNLNLCILSRLKDTLLLSMSHLILNIILLFIDRKLTAEEKKRRLEEMMDNAKWREDQRKQNVKRYEKEDKTEEESQKKHYETTGSSEFVK